MLFNKMSLFLLFIFYSILGAQEALEVRGQATWGQPEETNQSVIKRELFHQAFIEMANHGFKLIEKDQEHFWRELELKVAPFLTSKKAELQKKYAWGTPKWDPAKEKELNDDYRHAELIERRQFFGLAEAFKKIEIVGYSTTPVPKMEIKAIVDKELLLKTFNEITFVRAKGEWSKLFVELQVDSLQEFPQKNALLQELVKSLRVSWPESFKEIIVVDESLKADILSFMQEGADLSLKTSGNFSQSMWLKLHFRDIGDHSMSSGSLIYLPSHQVLGQVEAPQEKMAEEKKRFSLYQRKAQYLLGELKKGLKVELLFRQITLVKITQFASMLEVYQKIDEVKLKGQACAPQVELRKIYQGEAEILIKCLHEWPTISTDLGLEEGKLSAGAIKK